MSSFVVVEKEISYSVNFSQDLLYLILSSYISKKFTLTQKYIDFIDENNVRSRLANGHIQSTIKSPQTLNKMVHVHGNVLIPYVDRVSIERDVETVGEISEKLKKIIKCQVYTDERRPEIELKFEEIYLDKNVGDRFDSLMASKQVTLLNLLERRHETVSKNSHLGSDEILANIRLEYEYKSETPNVDVLDYMSELIREMDEIGHNHNISPLLPYTTIQNNIVYRKFEEERTLTDTDVDVNSTSDDQRIFGDDVLRWALKLDGIRGRGLFMRNYVVVFMDDMQLFSGEFPHLFAVNNVVAFQCELLGESELYITDLLHVFKYTYNNKTQYECSLDGYDIDPLAAVDCINYMGRMCAGGGLELKLGGDGNDRSFGRGVASRRRTINVKFQKFMNPPLRTDGYSSMATDGFVVLDINKKYVKYKRIRTVELEYNDKEKVFYTLNGPLTDYRIVSSLELEHNKIYEVAVTRYDELSVIKIRNDRLIPQLI
ncbi:lef4 [Hemileuca sp. nucleopolyhedrovirus]|uniref:Lef4 n=1 Tax=Hemileuca sp. nucleopolyhedrovirus TaxID=1367203 RepID=S5N388_9ABAC|nr:lef4 [Hemileuca sp. nucleopolyhedrovirus]AGR56830.1 lef4 [Hemileuca sp. nucleopolyhedrovirus]